MTRTVRGLFLALAPWVFLILLSGFLGYRNLVRLREDAGWVDHTHEVLDTLDRLLNALVDAETGQRGYLVTSRPEYLEPYQAGLDRIDTLVGRLKDLTQDNPEQVRRIPALQALIRARADSLQETLRLHQRDPELARLRVATQHGKELMDSIRVRIAEMDATERALLRQREAVSRHRYRVAVRSGIVLVLLGLALAGIFAWQLRRRLTERARTEQELEQQRRWLLVTLNSIGDAVIATDPEGRVTFMNPVAEQLTGWAGHEAVGQPLARTFRILNEVTRQPAANPVDRVLREGVVVGLANHTALLRKDGTELPIEDSAAPIRGAGEAIAGVVMVFHDVAEKRRAEEQLRVSEARYHSLFDSMTEEVHFWRLERDPDGRIRTWTLVDANPPALRTWGRKLEEIRGLSTDAIFGAGATEHYRAIVEKIFAERLPYQFEDYFPHLDKHFRFTSVPMDEHFITTGADITGLMNAQKSLQESEQRFRTLAEHIPQLCWMADADGWIVWYNRRWYDYTGTTPEQMEGWGWQSVHDPQVLPEVMTRWQASIASGRSFDMVFPLRGADGVFRPFLTRVEPVLDDSGRVTRWFGSNTDISETRRAEEERRQMEARLFQAQRLEGLGRLAGGVAHDINNVLAAILGLTSIHHEGLAPETPLAQALDTIATACLRGREVVKGLLHFARKDLEAPGPLDLNQLVKEVVHLLEATTLKVVQIATDLQEPLGLVQGDASAISHALMNVCLNAVDAMPGGGTLTIRSRATAAGAVELEVADTGTGMTPEVLKQAIDPFFTTKPVGKGTGLGLASVYGTMQAHGGSLDLHSEPARGTEVILAFPPFAAAPEPVPAPAAATAPAPAVPMARRILLVDDDELIRTSIPLILAKHGHQVSVAEGGQEALDQLAAGLQVDLVMLDLRMPGLDGAATLPRLLELRPGLPVLLATGHSDQDPRILVAGRPNLAAIRKPFTLLEFREKLGELDRQLNR